jgi:hypothetical protein
VIKTIELGATEKFFDGYWNDKVRKFRWGIIIFGFCIAIYAGVRSKEIKGLSRMEDYFAKTHYLSVALIKNKDGFNEGGVAQGITVDIMWGLKGINKDSVDKFNASDIGTAIWDNEFDITLGDNQ